MTIEDNKAITRRLHDAVNHGDIDALADLLSDDYREHNAISATTMDKRAAVEAIRAFKNAVPDAQHTLEQQTAEGEYVVDRFMWRGTKSAEFNGRPPGTKLLISVLAETRSRTARSARCAGSATRHHSCEMCSYLPIVRLGLE